MAKHSGKYLAVREAKEESGVDVIQWDITEGAEQDWKLIPAGDGCRDFVARHSGKCLAVEAGAKKNGARVLQRERTESDEQKWRIALAEVVWPTLHEEVSARRIGHGFP